MASITLPSNQRVSPASTTLDPPASNDCRNSGAALDASRARGSRRSSLARGTPAAPPRSTTFAASPREEARPPAGTIRSVSASRRTPSAALRVVPGRNPTASTTTTAQGSSSSGTRRRRQWDIRRVEWRGFERIGEASYRPAPEMAGAAWTSASVEGSTHRAAPSAVLQRRRVLLQFSSTGLRPLASTSVSHQRATSPAHAPRSSSAPQGSTQALAAFTKRYVTGPNVEKTSPRSHSAR